MTTCVFGFDRPEPIYYSGETVYGRVDLHTENDEFVAEVYISFKGASTVFFEERRSRKIRYNKTEYYLEQFRATENYAISTKRLLRANVLPAGLHTYTFSEALPTICGSSCVEKFGHITYEVSLTIERQNHPDIVYTERIFVRKPMDLNFCPDALIPLKAESIKYFCCWKFTSGPLISTLTLPFSGYVPDQEIQYELELNNRENSYDIYGIALELHQVYTFISHTPEYLIRSLKNTVAKAEKEFTCYRQQKQVIEGSILVPKVPPTKNDEGIITIAYFLKVFIKAGVCHKVAEIEVPIIIGTVPLRQNASNRANATAMALPTAPSLDTSTPYTSDLPPSYDSYEPPSFEQTNKINGPKQSNISKPPAPLSEDSSSAPLLKT
ncbi:arrestin domain-containing protein 17-like [Teleopsis dalmanni]|uniref:arrestin domain-containing protein 17-like n=1 Tax=Teleopsis dalmanni TaxID=139649 RepID=UPI0018CF6063|nr:arrestin domain-containing protein 17-like [Teleopsis dalmanni]